MHSRIITADIYNDFPIFLISKNLMLDSSNEPIHKTKREINDKSINIAYKHVLNENSPSNAYNEFLRNFFGLHNEAFLKKKIKIKRKGFNSPWITESLVKSSKKKQRLYEKFLNNKKPEKELNYKQYKTLFESLKKKSKKTIFIQISYQKNMKCYERNYWKQKSQQFLLPNFITVKNKEKNKLQKHLIDILLILVPT